MTSAITHVLAIFAIAVSASAASAATSRPNPPGEPTEVRVSIGLLDVDGVNGAEQSFEANVAYRASWQDSRLKHDGAGTISRPLGEVWHPRLQLINQQRTWSTLGELVDISPSGEVVLLQRVWGSFSQPLQLEDFPFDTQKFAVQLAAGGYTPDEVTLVSDESIPSGIAESFSLPDWEVLGSKYWVAEYQAITTDTVQASMFVCQFTARRHAGYYLFKIIVPLVLIVAMSWIVFWIDPSESGTQIGVSTTAMLTLIAFRFSIDGLVPKVSYLTRMDIFILGSTGLVFATLIQAVTTSLLAKSGRLPLSRKIDITSRIVFPIIFGAILIISV
jgi:hypothetical protein